MKLDTDIKYLKGVGERRAAMLSRLGVSDVNALVRLYPRVYEDWSRIKSINEAQIGEICCIKGIPGEKGTRCESVTIPVAQKSHS